MAALRTEFSAEIAAMHAVLSFNPLPMHTPLNTDIPLGATSEPQEGVDPTKPTSTMTSRRNLLKWGGIGAAATHAAAGGTALTSPAAHAADNGNMILGVGNSASNTTSISVDGTVPGATTLIVNNPLADTIALSANGGAPSSDNTAAYGVVGSAGNGITAYGVYGQGGSDANGVSGVAPGVNAYGVWGQSNSGFGLVGQTDTGIDMAATGTGRLWQFPTVAVGAPTTGSYLKGEQLRDANGDLYICVATGTPGTWRKVAAGVPDRSGAVNFLSKPIRLLDTRTTGAWLAGSTRTLQVTGVVINGISVPAGALAIVGNLTILSPSAAGAVSILPAPGQPSTGTFYFTTGQKFANGGTYTLSGSGQVTLVVSMPAGTHTHVLLDASGFIL
jgi:hypothetical protein